ncbi:2259_t:CDS:2, partial [Acaulospora colombiana]
MPPVQRKASSMGYDNYSAISEKSSTPQGKIRSRGRTAISGSNLRGSVQVNTLDNFDVNNFGRSGSNNSLRLNPLNTNDAGVSLLHAEHNSSPIATISANSSHVKSLQNNPIPHTQCIPAMLVGHNPTVQNASSDVQQQSKAFAEQLMASQKLQEIKNQDNKKSIDSKEISVSSITPKIVGATPVPHFVPKATALSTSFITANSAGSINDAAVKTSNMTASHV